MNEDFNDGAKAMFDFIMTYTANHWHANESINKICEKENSLINELAEEAFEEVSPDGFKKYELHCKMEAILKEELAKDKERGYTLVSSGLEGNGLDGDKR